MPHSEVPRHGDEKDRRVMDLAEWFKVVRDGVSATGRQLDPWEPWDPMLFFESSWSPGKVGMAVFDFDPTDEESRDIVSSALKKILWDTMAVRAAFGFEGIGVARGKDDDELTRDEVESAPDAVEVFFICAVDMTETLSAVAPVMRDGEQHPVIGEWDESGGASVEGDWIDAMRFTMQKHWELASDPVGILRRVLEQVQAGAEIDGDDRDALIAELEDQIQALESDPSILDSLPTRQWLNRQKGE